MPISLIILSLTTGLLTFLFIILSLLTIKRRQELRCVLGDGNDNQLQVRIRAHANFAEYVPLTIILMALAIAARISPYLQMTLSIMFVLGRYLHAYGLLSQSHKRKLRARIWGMELTLITLTVLAVYDVVKAVMYLL